MHNYYLYLCLCMYRERADGMPAVGLADDRRMQIDPFARTHGRGGSRNRNAGDGRVWERGPGRCRAASVSAGGREGVLGSSARARARHASEAARAT
jgi:hypothetical protein